MRFDVRPCWWDIHADRAVRALDRGCKRLRTVPRYMEGDGIVRVWGCPLVWASSAAGAYTLEWAPDGVPHASSRHDPAVELHPQPACYVRVNRWIANEWDWSGLIGLPVRYADGETVLFPAAVVSLAALALAWPVPRRLGNGKLPVGDIAAVPEGLYWRLRETEELGGRAAASALLAASPELAGSALFTP